MSLLYECINGVIQGGILDGAEGVREGEEIANLCVEKLRGMIVMEGDPNCKNSYVLETIICLTPYSKIRCTSRI